MKDHRFTAYSAPHLEGVCSTCGDYHPASGCGVFKEEDLRRSCELTPAQEALAKALDGLGIAIATHTGRSASGITVELDQETALRLGIAPGEWCAFATSAGILRVRSRRAP